MTIYDFFSRYFPPEVYDYYLAKVKSAVDDANTIIGFHTIPDLSMHHLSKLRTQTVDMLIDYDLNVNLYQEFNEDGKPIDKFHAPLNNADTNIINCRTKKLCSALVGSKEFARCFITSEYLYSVFKTGERHYFDYTSVVSGYFKSVELLLNTLMMATLDMPGSDTLWIKTKKTTKRKADETSSFRTKKDSRGNSIKQVQFKKNNIEYFSTEMGPLIHFVHDNKSGWCISQNGIEEVFKNLNNYSFGCRNQHFHKDIIDSIEQVEIIRKNTIICLLQLIGGYECFQTETNALEVLDVRDFSYNKMFNALKIIPKSQMKFIIRYKTGQEVQAFRFINQEREVYDDLGIITTPIRFIKSDNYSDYEKFENGVLKNDIITLTRENTDVDIWRVDIFGKRIRVIW